VKQERNGCGAASIAMIMQYWQKQQGSVPDNNADPVQIQRVLYSRRAHGIYASDVQQYFEQHDFRTFVFRGEWQQIREHLERGRPLIVALKPSQGRSLHYVVVAGMDSDRALLMVNDPAERKLLERERASFEKEWSATGNWTMLALPRQDGR
jgi:ABC-type bacteriocin/lantibiotic exporter with double-glycine peptidase domain